MNGLLATLLLSRTQLLFLLSLALAVLTAGALGLLISWALRRRPAPLRYGLMLSALGVAVLSPLLTVVSQRAGLGWLTIRDTPAPTPRVLAVPRVVAGPAVPAVGNTVATSATESAPRTPIDWLRVGGTVLGILWVVGLLAAVLQTVWSLLRLRRFMLTVRPCDDNDALACRDRAAQLLGLRATPRLLESDLLPVPMVIGLRKPVIVLPAGLARLIDPEKLEAVLLHETAHIAHGDLWIGLFQRLAGAGLWWCWLIHRLNRRIAELREDICDNYVLNVQGDGLKLAEVLVDLAERAHARRWRPPVCAMGAIDERTGLEGRIARLLQQRRNTMTRMNRIALAGTLGCGLLMSGLILATTVRAAEPDKPAETTAAPSAAELLATKDFWQTVGGTKDHDFTAQTIAGIVRIAESPDSGAKARLRAIKLVVDINKKTRFTDEFKKEDAERATGIAMAKLETELNSPTVQKFSPEFGFTHMIVSRRAGDAGAIWVLIESVDEARRGGLNIRVDSAKWEVTKIDHWGKVTERKDAAVSHAGMPNGQAIDEMVAARLKAAKEQPLPDQQATRIFLDMRGTPPTPAEVEAFKKDPSETGLKKLILKLAAEQETKPAAAAPTTRPTGAALDFTGGTLILTGPNGTDPKSGGITLIDPSGVVKGGTLDIAGGKINGITTVEGRTLTLSGKPTTQPGKPEAITLTFAGDAVVLQKPPAPKAGGVLYAATITLKQTDEAKVTTTLSAVLAGDTANDLNATVSGKLRQAVQINIVANNDVSPRQYTASVKIVEKEKVISSPRVVTREGQPATISIGDANGVGLTMELKIDAIGELAAPARVAPAPNVAAPAPKPYGFDAVPGGHAKEQALEVRQAELELHRAKMQRALLTADADAKARIQIELAEIDILMAQLKVERLKAQAERGQP